MLKRATSPLTWSAQRGVYELCTPDHPLQEVVSGEEEAWFAWLATQTSFSFWGQSGYLSVLKEARPRGAGYWYAYSCTRNHPKE